MMPLKKEGTPGRGCPLDVALQRLPAINASAPRSWGPGSMSQTNHKPCQMGKKRLGADLGETEKHDEPFPWL